MVGPGRLAGVGEDGENRHDQIEAYVVDQIIHAFRFTAT